MDNKIALEEHFAIEDSLRESAEYAVPGQWNVLERRLIDVDGERLEEMDKNGIAFAILSLNAPGVQSTFDRGKAVDYAKRANDVLAATVQRHPDRYAAICRRRHAGSRGGVLRAGSRRPRSEIQGRDGQRVLADRRPEHHCLLR